MENIFDGHYIKVYDFEDFNGQSFVLLVNEWGNTQSFSYDCIIYTPFDYAQAFIFLLDKCITDEDLKLTETINFFHFLKDNFTDYHYFDEEIRQALNIDKNF